MIDAVENIGARNAKYASLVLRVGLAIVFLLFAYHKLNINTFGQGAAEIELLFNMGIGTASAINFYVGILELAIGIMLLSGWHVRMAGLVAAGMTFFIFLSYLKQQGISLRPDLYRDLGLAAAGLALFLLGKGKINSDTKSQS